MNYFAYLIFVILFFSLSIDITAQNLKQSKQKTNQIKQVGNQNLNEAAYYAPIRYVIVYNDIFKLKERRIEVLIDEENFNKENLIIVFDLIKKRFPKPFMMRIGVHTSLATIETPEERELAKDDKDSRFGDKRPLYKNASFLRLNDGSEGFFYTVSLDPYQEEEVDLVGKYIN
jgi:hypothetical protein